MKSPTYWHPFIYSMLLKMSYGGGYRKRYQAVSDLIEAGSSVTDVCCGDCRIYEFLKDKKIDYLGLDFNSFFIKWAVGRGIKARRFDIHKDDIPKSDYVLMMGSLYQFYPRHGELLERLFGAASRYLILSEPVKNNAQSESKVVSLIAKKLNNPGDGVKGFRFNIDTLKEAMEPFHSHISKELYVADNIEYVTMIKKG